MPASRSNCRWETVKKLHSRLAGKRVVIIRFWGGKETVQIQEPLAALMLRYARGEIGEEEYRRIKEDLEKDR